MSFSPGPGGSLLDAKTIPALHYAVCDRTSVPVDEQRLVFNGRQLDEGSFESYGLFEGATVGLVLR